MPLRVVPILALFALAACNPPPIKLATSTLGGTVTGLTGTGLVLMNEGTNALTITQNGPFTFSGTLTSGTTYFVTVKTQPTGPGQTCTVGAAQGTMNGTNVTNVAVTCAVNAFTVGGSVAGVSGSGLVLQDNGGDNLTVSSDGTFTFATPVTSGAAYAVTVLTPPSAPAETCTVSNGTGTVGTAPVTNVLVTCLPLSFTIGGSISGLQGSGLILEDNGGDALTINSGTTFTFATKVAAGGTFAVTVATQPSSPTQTCTVSGGSGTVVGGNVTSVTVNCASNTYTVGGVVLGLTGSGLSLQDNDGDNLNISANGEFAFSTPIASGGAYLVTVLAQPATPTQTCAVTGGSGTIATSNVTAVSVTCTTNTYALSGTVTGLKGTGLVLQDNGGDNLTLASGATTLAFATPLASGATYSVEVATQPSNPTQTCTVSNGHGVVGSAAVTNIAVTCSTQTYTVSGSVVGLSGSGLVLQDNGADNLSVSANGLFTFATPVASGALYAVTVFTQPSSPAQTCTVSGGAGSVATGNVTDVLVNCSSNTYALSGTVVGLTGTGLVLQDNGGDDLALAAGATTFAFMMPLASGDTYSIEVSGQPSTPSQNCVVSNDAQGTVGNAPITDIVVTCTTNTYSVGGVVTGLAGSALVLQDNGGNNLNVATNGAFTFSTPVASGGQYAVSVLTQPTNPTQTCTVASGSGAVGNSAVISVVVNCSTNAFAIGGTVSGLLGTGLVLEDNGGDDLTVNSNSTFAFAKSVGSGGSYAVTVKTQPTSPAQTCTVSGGSGTVVNGNVTSVTVNCASNTYTVGGVVLGMAGSGMVLQDNGGDSLSVSANGLFAFATPIASGGAYAVTVLTQPSNPTQVCSVSAGSGNVATSNITSVSVTCSTNTYALSGTIKGLTGSGLVLTDNGGDAVNVSAGATTFSFKTPLASGAAYSVQVGTQPSSPSQTCVVSNDPHGVVGSSAITDIVVTCATGVYTVGGTVTGLTGSGMVLQDNGGDNYTVTGNGVFTFATPVGSGNPYAVTILTQPTSPAQTCVVTGSSGTVVSADVITVAVNCATNDYTVGGSTIGLTGSGLQLSLNGLAALPVTANGAFTFAQTLAAGSSYSVTIMSQPTNPTQTCTVSGGAGTVGASNVTSVVVNCGTNAFTIGGAITGLSGSGLVLQDNGGDNLSITANGLFSFATPLASGSTYTVTVFKQPSNPTQTCTLSGATGTVVTSNITTVVVSCTANTYPVSGTITGLTGTGLVLEDNGGDNVTPMPGATTFAFPTALASGVTYTVSVATQPSTPNQTCVVSTNATGVIGTAQVTSVAVTCTTNTYTVGGTVVGLLGTGLVLQDNSGTNLTITGNGGFTFATPVLSGGTFDVTVLTQPSAPAQTCVVTGATGSIVNAAVQSVTVDCGSNSYTVSGAVSGLAGSGLVLSLNGQSDVTVQSNGQFSFPEVLTDGSTYAVTILTQPTTPTQTCTLTAATGTISAANVSNVAVSCGTDTYPITVNVSGLTGSGLVLEDNGSDTLAVPSSGAYTFPTLINSGAGYAVTVSAQPTDPTQTCVVAGGSGTVTGAAISNVTVSCTTNTFTVGGTIYGLAGTIVLENNGKDALIVTPALGSGPTDGGSPDAGSGVGADGGSADGGTSGATGPGIAFTFATPIASGGHYAVTVSQQPGSPSQTCTVTADPSGTIGSAAIKNVVVNCTTNTYNVDVTVVGLAGTGLVLGDNVGDMVSVTANGPITLPTKQASNTNYAVTVVTQPTGPAQTCNVIGGTGTVGASDVTGITVNCGVNSYALGGTVSGLSGEGLVVADNVGDTVSVSGDGTFSFPTPYASGAPYSVTVQAQPQGPWQTCTVTNGSGTIATANVTNVAVSCATNGYTIAASVTGLSGAGLQLLDNGSDLLAVAQDGLVTFATSVPSEGTYSVTVLSQPTTPSQTCTVANGTGTVAGANVTVAVSCVVNTYAVSVSVSGLSGNGLQLLDNGTDSLSVTGNGTFPFPTPIPSGTPYDVIVATQPSGPAQTCIVSSPAGTMGGAAVTLNVACSTTSFTVGGILTGLAATESVQLTNGTDSITVNANGAFTFDASVASGATYAVSVGTQPSSPVAQTCTVTSGSGQVTAANVTNVAVTCVTDRYTVGGTLSGYAGSGLVLQDNGGDNLTVLASATTFTFATSHASGAAYSVSVLTQPTNPSQTCSVASGAGTIAAMNVTSVAVTCTTNTYTFGGTIAGLAGGSVVLADSVSTNSVTVSVDGTFQFPAVASGASYSVTVQTQPSSPAQTCAVMNGTGMIAGAAVTNISVTCSTTALTVGGTLSGYAGSGLQLQLNGTNTLTVLAGSGTFTFGALVNSGQAYAVTVLTQPTSPTQTCTVSSGTGTVGSSNVTSVAVACGTTAYTFGGVASGLASGASVVLQDSVSSNTVTITADGAFQFPAVASGSNYLVSVETQPSSPAQTCTVTNGMGSVTTANVTNLVVACTTNTFTIGGTVTGLLGTGLQLELNGANAITVLNTADTFTFVTQVRSNGAYAVTVSAQPTTPTQTCTVSSGTGTVGTSNVTSVAVSCTTSTYTAGGVVSGLAAGSSVVLEDADSTNTVTVTANGAFAFPAETSGSMYAVSVETEPTSPTQSCTVTNGTGTLTTASITNIVVACTTTTYTVGGTISGLSGSGLQLLLNGANAVLPANGALAFTFSAPVASNGTYAVSVGAQPAGLTQTCTVANASGTVTTANITNVAVTCATSSYAVSGTVAGLVSGASVVLQDVSSTNIVTVSVDGAFQFPAQLSGSNYAVTVQTQPSSPVETCSVTNGMGTVTTGPISGVVVTCSTSAYTIGGTITGYTGSGLQLLLNGADPLSVTNASSTFTFSNSLASGSTYAVSVGTQPSTPTQSCTVATGSGNVTNANITSVAITCSTTTFTVGGVVSGLASGATVVLQDTLGTNTVSVMANGAFAFPAQNSNSTYTVTVQTQPTSPVQVCSVTNGMGTVTTAAITNILVACSTTAYTVGGTISGYTGTGLQLLLNGANAITPANGPFQFTTSIASNGTYAVSVGVQPSVPTQSCIVTNATGTVTNANVTTVTVTCTTTNFTVGGTVSGLAGGTLILQNNSATNTVSMSADGTFQFPAQASNTPYAVTVKTQPSVPTQSCTVTNGTGTVGSASVTNVAVSCTTPTYTIGGSITGYSTSSGLVLLLNGQYNLGVTANATTFTFSQALASGANYAVTIGTQPSAPTQVCSVTNGTGTGVVGAANVASVTISCVTNTYTIGGTVTGLSGNSVILQNNNSATTVTVTGNGSFTFPAQGSATAYAVTVNTSPTSPSENCTVTNGSGTVGSANITNIVVQCAVSGFTVGGTVSGLTGHGLFLSLNGTIDVSVASGATSFTFGTTLASNTAYAVTVVGQPASPPQICSVTAGTGSGTVTNANITTVAVTCTTAYQVANGWLGSLGTRPGIINTTAADGGPMTVQIVNDGFEYSTLVGGDGGTAAPYKVQACAGGADGGEFCLSGGIVP